MDGLSSIGIVVSTVPPSAEITLPDDILNMKPTVMELVYLPRETKLVLQAREHELSLIEGIEVLVEQAIGTSMILLIDLA